MQKLTKSEAIANHRKMWRWIATQTRKQKRKVEKWEYFEHFKIPKEEIPYSLCYCCEYDVGYCQKCPVNWGRKFNGCCDKDEYSDGQGLFALWRVTADWQKAAHLAEQIAELPEREDVV